LVRRARLGATRTSGHARARRRARALLIAPTGGGKTLAGFLPTLADWRAGMTGCTRSMSRR
jgi:superfamily II DNA helicase RecQ